MKRHKFPALLVIVILTAITIVSFEQVRPRVSADTAKPVMSRPEKQSASSGQPMKLSQHQATNPATARALNTETENKSPEASASKDSDHPSGLIALTKVEGTD